MKHWLSALQSCGDRQESAVLVTVIGTRGSTPREIGAKMLVRRDASDDTIGGGNLEYRAIEIARELLAGDRTAPSLRRFPLGSELGQCCGGVAELLFEPIGAVQPAWVAQLTACRRRDETAVLVSIPGTAAEQKMLVSTAADYGALPDPQLSQTAAAYARQLLDPHARAQLTPLGTATPVLFEPQHSRDFPIVLFGAGHVGKALVQVLSTLPCSLTWVDSREDLFPGTLPPNVQIELSDAPEYEVERAPPGSYFLIMTHSHPLDQAICERVLRREDFHYCGLIGSASKRRQFEKRMQAHGLPVTAFERLTCPVGVDGISGKLPAEIAIAVAAELLQVREAVNQGMRPAKSTIVA